MDIFIHSHALHKNRGGGDGMVVMMSSKWIFFYKNGKIFKAFVFVSITSLILPFMCRLFQYMRYLTRLRRLLFAVRRSDQFKCWFNYTYIYESWFPCKNLVPYCSIFFPIGRRIKHTRLF